MCGCATCGRHWRFSNFWAQVVNLFALIPVNILGTKESPVLTVEGDGVDDDAALRVERLHLTENERSGIVWLPVRQQVDSVHLWVRKRKLENKEGMC